MCGSRGMMNNQGLPHCGAGQLGPLYYKDVFLLCVSNGGSSAC